MEDMKWLWDYLRDLYKPPTTYLCSRERFDWMCYTSTAVEQLKDFVESRTAKKWKSKMDMGLYVLDQIKIFYTRTTLFKDLSMSMAYNSVAKAAEETWKAAIYR